jgi:hypothetical protein
MAVTADTILKRVRTQLIDELEQKRWTDDELLRWLSDGQRTLVALDPALGETTDRMQLAVGTKQTLPPNAFMLLDIKNNLGLDGDTPGRVVTVISRENLDRVDPNWHASRRSDVTFHYIYDPKQPKTFYVYPPSTGVAFLDISAAYTPPDFADLTTEMVVPDLYQTALFDYVMFRAHQKDSDYASGEGKAGVYLQLFQMFTGATTDAVLAESPNKQLGPTDLADKGAAA